MYTSVLEDVVIVNSKSVFPAIGAIGRNDAASSLLKKHKQLHWTKWINSDIVYSLEEKPANFDASLFRVALDADATVLHTDTLKVLNQGLNINLTPQYSSWAMKIKHEYKGVTLHNVVNVEIG